MNKLNTTTVSMAVTPTVISTLFSHYLNRKPLKERPTAHLSYDEGLHLVRAFLDFASHHTVEELQAFTGQWVPHPQWVKVDSAKVDSEHLDKSAELIQAELGDDGLEKVGGKLWWQWRKPGEGLDAEWIEMRSHANERKKANNPGHRVMLYVHGGAYFFGSVDEHRYQMQRHARKLKARVFAPRYRLSPQFPFPCGLQDCLAAYLQLLTTHDPSNIVVAGDSAGGGMVLSLLCVLRNQGMPLPAGGILISPWVDLTHSFPSVTGDAPMDYIPQCGFHHKPSQSWPPPNEDDIAQLREDADAKKASKSTKSGANAENNAAAHGSAAAVSNENHLSLEIDGEQVLIKDQIQMYTTNSMLRHPLVSPAMQASLGGLPPLLVMVGGGEILRDEQIYVAHKCANPQKYAPPLEALSAREKEQLGTFKPTDVQLQVWDDMCHVGPTLSFTRPAKYMYRSIAQFGAWALAHAQHRGIEIMDDDQISIISSSDTDEVEEAAAAQETANPADAGKLKKTKTGEEPTQVGKAGDPLPKFKRHMIRQQVSRHGVTTALAPESELPGCCMDQSLIGVIKEPTAKKWLAKKAEWDTRFAAARTKVHKKILKDFAVGYDEFGPGERPPPAALAGRRRIGSYLAGGKKKKSLGLAIWALWGSKHDEETLEREQKAVEEDQKAEAAEGQNVGEGQSSGLNNGDESHAQPLSADAHDVTSRSRSRTVVDQHQVDEDVDENTPVAQLIQNRQEKEKQAPGLLSPDFVPETGTAGRRPFLKGIAMPFALSKDADTASMLTLDSAVTPMEANKQLSTESTAVDTVSDTQAELSSTKATGVADTTDARQNLQT